MACSVFYPPVSLFKHDMAVQLLLSAHTTKVAAVLLLKEKKCNTIIKVEICFVWSSELFKS